MKPTKFEIGMNVVRIAFLLVLLISVAIYFSVEKTQYSDLLAMPLFFLIFYRIIMAGCDLEQRLKEYWFE